MKKNQRTKKGMDGELGYIPSNGQELSAREKAGDEGKTSINRELRASGRCWG